MFQSLLMVVGVVLLFMLVVPAASQAGFSQPTLDAVQATGPGFASGPGYSAARPLVPAAHAGAVVFRASGSSAAWARRPA